MTHLHLHAWVATLLFPLPRRWEFLQRRRRWARNERFCGLDTHSPDLSVHLTSQRDNHEGCIVSQSHALSKSFIGSDPGLYSKYLVFPDPKWLSAFLVIDHFPLNVLWNSTFSPQSIGVRPATGFSSLSIQKGSISRAQRTTLTRPTAMEFTTIIRLSPWTTAEWEAMEH